MSDSKKQKIIERLKTFQYEYLDIPETSIDKVYDLFFLDYIAPVINSSEALYFGVYFNHIKVDKNEMIKYYLMAIELGNSYAANNLARYYQLVEHNMDLS